jgi:putative spermidine/putrescine transport system ATP-binding protein
MTNPDVNKRASDALQVAALAEADQEAAERRDTPAPPPAPEPASITRSTDGTRVEFRDVTRVFGNARALAGLSLNIEPGELLALLGPSGCGKTTALRILAGFDYPTSGAVLVNGSDVTGTPVNRRDMGMVFQAYSLFPTMTARDNVAFGLRLRRQDKSARRSRADDLLDLVGLSAHAEKYPHQMSGGQQQRVALARALAVSPRVLLLDEPLSALDAKVREQLREEIRRIHLELGVTTVFVTHDQEEALSMADRVAVMNAGQLEQVAPPAELYHQPATTFVAQFVGSMNHLPGTLTGSGLVRVNTSGQQLDLVTDPGSREGTAVSVLVRPEAVVLDADESGDGVVVLTAFRGATTRVQVLLSDGTELHADVAQHLAARLPAGVRVRVTVHEQPVLVETA